MSGKRRSYTPMSQIDSALSVNRSRSTSTSHASKSQMISNSSDGDCYLGNNNCGSSNTPSLSTVNDNSSPPLSPSCVKWLKKGARREFKIIQDDDDPQPVIQFNHKMMDQPMNQEEQKRFSEWENVHDVSKVNKRGEEEERSRETEPSASFLDKIEGTSSHKSSKSGLWDDTSHLPMAPPSSPHKMAAMNSEMDILNDLLSYINQEIGKLSSSENEDDNVFTTTGAKKDDEEQNEDESFPLLLPKDNPRSIFCQDVSKSNCSEQLYLVNGHEDDVNRVVEDCDVTDEGIVVTDYHFTRSEKNHVPYSNQKITSKNVSSEDGLSNEQINSKHQLPSNGEISLVDQVIAGRSPSTEPSGNFSLTTTDDDKVDDGDDESSLEDRLNGSPISGVVIRNNGSATGNNKVGRKPSPLISFNDLSVVEIESFLEKHRKTPKMKEEGSDTILFLPEFIQNAMNFLMRHGIRKEGIFRRSGVKSRINLLCQNNTNLTNMENVCPYDVADFLKSWFRNQVPLLPATLVKTLLPLIRGSSSNLSSCSPSHSSSSSSGSSSSAAANAASNLSTIDLNNLRAHLMVFPNRLAIETLMRFLAKISQHEKFNSMSVANMAIVWTPSLCREHSMVAPIVPSHLDNTNNKSSPTPSPSVSSNLLLESVSNFMKDARELIEFLITNVDKIFCISRTDLLLPSPPNSFIRPSSTSSSIENNDTRESSPCPSIRRGIRPPSIGCRRKKMIKASAYDVFLRIILERRTWDPLVTEIIDEGSGVQKIKHGFSHFMRPLPTCNSRHSSFARSSVTSSHCNPHHRVSHSDSDDDETGSRYLTIKRKWPESLDPSVETIQIHEESLDDPASRTRNSTGMPSYICDWFITLSPNSNSTSSNPKDKNGPEIRSEVNVAIYADFKGRPLIWYQKTFPRLIDCYLDRISSFFEPKNKQQDLLDGVIQTRQQDDKVRNSRRLPGPSFDPFCCLSMKHVVQT